jgi:predicted MPP superfamily phosphohydrolase
MLYDRFRDLGIQVYQIVGNHDAYYKNTNEVNSIESLLKEYDNIVPISSPGEYEVAGLKTFMIPWISSENREETLEKLSKTKAKLAFGHLELNGFSVYPGNVQQHGMEVQVSLIISESFVRVIITLVPIMERSSILEILTNFIGTMWTIREDSTFLIRKHLN